MPDVINWNYVNYKIGNLQPWDRNPKTSTKKDARILLKSWDELGQFQTIAIGPAGEVYDGHQRLSALQTVYGPEYTISALQASRELDEKEREKIAVYSRQIGGWDWQTLSAWDTSLLMEAGFDDDMLKNLNADVAALAEMLGKATADFPDEEDVELEKNITTLAERFIVPPFLSWMKGRVIGRSVNRNGYRSAFRARRAGPARRARAG